MSGDGGGLRLPEYVCPHCQITTTLIPGAFGEDDRCSTCRGAVVLLPGDELAARLPPRIDVLVEPDAVDVTVSDFFVGFGLAENALRYRIERDAIVWSRPPFLGTVRVGEAWERLPRAPLKSVDWRLFERGLRGTREHEEWADVVFVAHDTSERISGHRFAQTFDGPLLTTVIQAAHELGAQGADVGGAYRGAARARRVLPLVTAGGRVIRIGA